jgi:hypothetical protein
MMQQNHGLIQAVLERDQTTSSQERAHVERVAAWCVEIGLILTLPVTDCQILEQAARLHHRTGIVVKADAWDSLRRDLRLSEPIADRSYTGVLEVLRALHGDRRASNCANQLAMILEQCDDLDNACELDAEIAADPDVNGLEQIVPEVAVNFRGRVSQSALSTSAPSDDAGTQGLLNRLRAGGNLPVFPAVATKVFDLLADDNMNFGDLESIISSDQTIAGHIHRCSQLRCRRGAYSSE